MTIKYSRPELIVRTRTSTVLMFSAALAPLCALAQQESSSGGQLEEVVVSAQKRDERLQDVPVPVTAINGLALTENNQLRLQEYFANAPGLSFNTDGTGETRLSIRGLGTGRGTVPTVGLTLDDVPLGSSTAKSSNQAYAPDIDPGDLQRVEVLRGPQGTLYGAASLGGLVKYVTMDPSTEKFSGRIQVDANSVHNGDELGRGVRVSVNVPLSETFAMRASGFLRQDAGYIDDPSRGIDGVNQAEAYGGRVSALWRPSDAFSIKAGVQTQDWTAEGKGIALPGLGDLEQRFLRGTGEWRVRMRIFSAVATAKLGDVDLTSVSGYSTQGIFGVSDYTPYLPASVSPITGDIRTTLTKKLSQELRLNGTWGNYFDWLVGAFYTRESNDPKNYYFAWDAASGTPGARLAFYHYPNTFEEYAGFADLTVHFTDRFDVQFGGRYSTNRQVYDRIDAGPIIPFLFNRPSPLITPTIRTEDGAFTYLVTPRFRISSDLMTYLRVASGYRPGGSNPKAYAASYPDSYEPDKTVNYELGIKGAAFGGKLSFDASLYYIDWDDIQLSLIEAASSRLYQVNASSAKSQGVEVSAQLNPIDGMTISGWFVWNDAVLTSNLPAPPPAFGLTGHRLPYASRASGNLAIEQDFPLGSMEGFARVVAAYVGERKGDFPGSATALRLSFPSYVQTDLSAGVHYREWTLRAFVNNVADERGLLARPVYGPGRFAYSYIQPRTVGMAVSRTF